jgi:sugar O-acyltransferase (sialic acid O-acetyltransferase NeuD family)
MEKIIIFGTGDIAQLANFYFTTDSEHEVVAFTVDNQYLKKKEFEGKPVIPFENVLEFYPPSKYKMFIAVSYARLNSVRKEKYDLAKLKGYELMSYISTKCSYLSSDKPGDNCFILEDNTIQPFVRIGNNVTIWSGNHIGHHSIIEDDIFISSHVVISGHCNIKSKCFLGVNCTISNNVTLYENCIIGAGAVIVSNIDSGTVFVPPKSTKLNRNSSKIQL